MTNKHVQMLGSLFSIVALSASCAPVEKSPPRSPEAVLELGTDKSVDEYAACVTNAIGPSLPGMQRTRNDSIVRFVMKDEKRDELRIALVPSLTKGKHTLVYVERMPVEPSRTQITDKLISCQ